MHPRDLSLAGDALCFGDDARRVDVVYRFLELHDLPNIPKIDLLIYAMKQRLAVVTPPFKAHLEEKLLMALFRHAALQDFWRGELGGDAMERLGEWPWHRPGCSIRRRCRRLRRSIRRW